MGSLRSAGSQSSGGKHIRQNRGAGFRNSSPTLRLSEIALSEKRNDTELFVFGCHINKHDTLSPCYRGRKTNHASVRAYRPRKAFFCKCFIAVFYADDHGHGNLNATRSALFSRMFRASRYGNF